jgi:hypothetical protein
MTIAGDPDSPWILHVPHASTRIPGTVCERILLDDDALDAELQAMTDAHTDLLAKRITRAGHPPTPLVVCQPPLAAGRGPRAFPRRAGGHGHHRDGCRLHADVDRRAAARRQRCA